MPHLRANPAEGATKVNKSDVAINLAAYCIGDGVAEDAAGFLAAWNALPAEGGRLTSPPGKKYRLSSNLALDGKADVEVDLNGSYIESRVASGALLTITNSARGRWRSPRFRLLDGAPASMMLFDGGVAGATGSWWSIVEEPVIWVNINVPANFDGIVVQNDNYWIEVRDPEVRKLSGGLTGNVRRAVSFISHSNAGKVIDGSINNTDVGVFVDSSNAVEVKGTAFEFVTDTVWAADSLSSCAGLNVHDLRVESIGHVLNLSGHSNRQNFFPPIRLGHIEAHDGDATLARYIYNPNNVLIDDEMGGRKRVASSWANMNPQLRLQAADNPGVKNLIETFQRDLTAPWVTNTVQIEAADVAFTVTDTTALPASGTLRVEGSTAAGIDAYEYVTYSAKAANSLTISARGQSGTTAQQFEPGALITPIENQTFAVDSNGILWGRSSLGAPAAKPGDGFQIWARASLAKFIAYSTAGANGFLSVMNAGVLTDVADWVSSAFRPSTDATIDLGGSTRRWRRLFASEQVIMGRQTINTDANFTLQPSSLSAPSVRHTGTLTADRTITLSTTGAVDGMSYEISRSGAGAFNLIVGGLKNLATGQWCVVKYDGTAWYLDKFGSL